MDKNRTLQERTIDWLVWTNRISRPHADTINWDLITDSHVIGNYYSEITGKYHLQVEAWIVSGDFTPKFNILHDNN